MPKRDKIPKGLRKQVITRDRGLCQKCKSLTAVPPEERSIHHRIPRSKGGATVLDNLELTHRRCHEEHHDAEAERQGKSKRKPNCMRGEALALQLKAGVTPTMHQLRMCALVHGKICQRCRRYIYSIVKDGAAIRKDPNLPALNDNLVFICIRCLKSIVEPPERKCKIAPPRAVRLLGPEEREVWVDDAPDYSG